jgi:hypothetical protein
MNLRKFQFLNAVVGPEGARALSKAAEYAEELDQAIFPRTILAWLDLTAPFGHNGTVPGVDEVKFTCKKSESNFTGSITVDGELYRFENASLNHVAGCIAVALGLDHERVSPQARPEQIAKLGKSIDLLVKSNLVKDQMIPKKKLTLPGMAAKPIQPIAPEAPTPVQPKNQTPQLPKQKKKPTIQITKSEAQKKCPHCMRPQFNGDSFRGCFCWAALAKNLKAIPTADGFTLEFGPSWDLDAILTLEETFKGK